MFLTIVTDIRQRGSVVRGSVRRPAVAGFVIFLGTLSVAAVAAGRIAQNGFESGRAATEPGQARLADTPAAPSANSPEQIRKAQTELKRLDCLKGRIDGKLGDQTRQAVKKFWTSAKLPEAEVDITDELIAHLAERGDNFCRPPRRFFGFGGRPGGNAARLPFLAPGARPGPVPATAAQPPAPAAAH